MKRSIVAVLIIMVLGICVVQVAQAGGDKLYMCSSTMEDTDPNMVGVMGEKIVFFEESYRSGEYNFAVGFDTEAKPIVKYFWSDKSDMPNFNHISELEEIHDYIKFADYHGFVFLVFDGERRNIVRVPSNLLKNLIIEVSDDGRIVVKNFQGEPCQKSCSDKPPLAIADPVNPNHVRIPSENMLVDDNNNKVSCSIEPSVNIADIFDPKKVSVPSDDMLVDCDFCSPCPPLCLQNPDCPGFLMVPRDEVLVNK